jgi:peptide/nickel transport system permease protein
MKHASWPALGACLLAMCFLGPLFWPASPYDMNQFAALLPPGPTHPLGTDELGRDMLARLLAAGRDTFAVALPATAISFAAGLAYGLTAGLGPAWIDAVLMRVLDAVLAVPPLVLLVAAAAMPFFTAGRLTLILLIAAVAWPGLARLVRAEALAMRRREFVLAARQMGGGPLYIARRHAMPVMARLLAVNASFLLGDTVLALSSLSFLGLGVQPPHTSWGGLLQAGLQMVDLGVWWLILPPGLALFLTLLAASGLSERIAAGQQSR